MSVHTEFLNESICVVVPSFLKPHYLQIILCPAWHKCTPAVFWGVNVVLSNNGLIYLTYIEIKFCYGSKIYMNFRITNSGFNLLILLSIKLNNRMSNSFLKHLFYLYFMYFEIIFHWVLNTLVFTCLITSNHNTQFSAKIHGIRISLFVNVTSNRKCIFCIRSIIAIKNIWFVKDMLLHNHL